MYNEPLFDCSFLPSAPLSIFVILGTHTKNVDPLFLIISFSLHICLLLDFLPRNMLKILRTIPGYTRHPQPILFSWNSNTICLRLVYVREFEFTNRGNYGGLLVRYRYVITSVDNSSFSRLLFTISQKQTEFMLCM